MCYEDRATKELARQLKLMCDEPTVKANVKRVAEKLGAFKILKSGQVARIKPAK